MYPTGNAPMDTSASFSTETASEYFTDNTTTGSRTPRQSLDHSMRDETDAESQLYQDARSFADVSMVSLVPSSYTPSASGNNTAATAPQIGGRLAPHGASSASTSSSTPTAVATPTPASSNSEGPTAEQSNSSATGEISTAGIDTPTLRAHEQDPLETVFEVSPATKADVVASEMAQTVGKQVATQEPLNMVNKPDATVPSPTKQATATLPEEARPDTSLPGQQARAYVEDHQSVSNNLLGVGAGVAAASALPASETVAPADAAAATAAGAGTGTAPLSHDNSPSTTINMNGTGHSSSNGDQAYNEKHGDSEKKGLFGHGGNDGHKKEKKGQKRQEAKEED